MDFRQLTEKPKEPEKSQLELLAEKEKELQAKMQELEAMRLSMQKELEDTKKKRIDATPFSILVDNVEHETVCVLNEYNEKFLEILRSTQGRMYGGGNKNFIPISSWPTFLSKLNGIEVKYSPGIEDKIKSEIEKPRAKIYLSENKKQILIDILRRESWLAHRLQGIKRISPDRYQINVGEAWQLGEKLIKEPNIEWDEEVKKLIVETTERRELLDKIATAEDADVKVDMPITLRPFQRVGIKFGELVDYKFILADQMGLGKTIQGIGCAQVLKEKNGKCRTLVICPAGLKTNWSREINRLAGKSPLVLYGENPNKFLISELLEFKHEWVIINYDIFSNKVKHSVPVKTADGTILNTQVQWVFPWVEVINALNFDLVILDESHYIKNVESNRSTAARKLKAKRTIFMTGTPVLNRPGELWPMLTIIDPDRFPSYENFTYIYGDRQATNVESLRQSLKNVMIRRRKKDVLKDLPPINRIYEWHELSPAAIERYKLAKAGLYQILAEWEPDLAGEERNITNLLVEIMRLKQICAIDKVESVADMALELSDSDDNGGKVLIFSQFVPVVNEITKRLGHEAVAYTGEAHKDERIRIYDRFVKDPNLKFLVATWQTAGEGLNLQCANNVIFADLFWTPASHQQCEERAYGRLADPHPINSYYLVCADTIEVWIQEILARKLNIIEQVVEGLDTERSASIANELLRKLKQELR